MSDGLRAELGEALSAVVADMQAAATDLRQALADERAALDQADPAALDRSGDAKQALLRRLEQLETERRQLAQASPSAAMPRGAWSRVLELLQECQRTNQRNGRLIGQRLQHVRRALAVLTGASADADVYGPAGQLRHARRSSPLAQA
ncbi:flagellar protein FlgN [Fulvimonas sp. R45]|uniref:flagella synthesis protein FlgN n=1 Tax=Fulvimonas sp. R45 TaxID=3045937 RepID=UPI00265F9D61|nr:flagellar protein FlgN [Fulvimonas sp. R45]MDO1528330.1 flagellar protein FlgN [Fulvimonas sp. R45]